MIRRRLTSHQFTFGGAGETVLASHERDDERYKRRRKHTFDRKSATKIALIASILSLLFVFKRTTYDPFRSNRMLRKATVRLWSSARKIRSWTTSSSIIFQAHNWNRGSIISPENYLPKSEFLRDIGRPKFNGLVIQPLAIHSVGRAIDVRDNLLHNKAREELLEEIDEEDERTRSLHYEDYAPKHRECQRNNWRDKRFLNCQTFHETSVLDRPLPGHRMHDYDIEYTGHGYFRDSWIYRNGNEQFVLKKLRLIDNFDYNEGYMYQIHREAIVMERLTASPRIVNIYGHCATSIMSEPMLHEVTNDLIPNSRDDSYAGYIEQPELNKLQVHDVRPMNNLTNEQKLDIAIAMAESIAEIHGYEGGVIIHGDIHPYQWLSNAKGEIKLNDFNNGEILDFNVEKQEYCKIYRCFGGTYRSPEEFRCIDSNEGMDTYSMANNIYVLLTGLWPFYQYDPDDSEFVQDLLIHNKEKPFVDPRYRSRSSIEAGLVKVMELAWEWDLDKRESIFDMLRQLYELRDRVAK